jgi:WD40-like Beta Propeller Repeat
LPWSVDVECATWFPDGSKILIAGTDYPGAPLRPATINPDGTGSTVLDASEDPNLNLGCGDVSPDGTRLVLEGFSTHDDPSVSGLYSVRATDGGDLIRLTHCGGEPAYLPDGRITTGCTKPGHPLIGAHYVLNADGSGMHRITPWQSWGVSGRGGDGRMEGSPDGRWLVFTQDDGTLGLVHPDGTGFHTIPIEQPRGSTAGWPQWSPDGSMIVFELADQGETHIYKVRPDGSDLTAIVNTPGVDEKDPAWGPAV